MTPGGVTFCTLGHRAAVHPGQRTVALVAALDIRSEADGNLSFEGTFSPDGRHLLVESAVPGDSAPARRLAALDVDSGNLLRLTDLPGAYPSGPPFLQPAWS